MERSKLDDVYSLSSKLTCKEMWDSMPGSSNALTKLTLELNKYIDPYTGKVKSDYKFFENHALYVIPKILNFYFLNMVLIICCVIHVI